MFIKNYADTAITVNIKDNKVLLPADTITYVDENVVTLTQLKNMYGNYVEEITDTEVTDLIPKIYLKYTQVAIALGTLYKVQPMRVPTADRLKSIFVDSGSLNIYAYDGATQPAALSNMVLSTTATNIAGESPFEVVPTYLAVAQNTGTSTEIILNGIEIISNLGEIS